MQCPSHLNTLAGLHFLTEFDLMHFLDKIVATLKSVAELSKVQEMRLPTLNTDACVNSAFNAFND